MHTATKLAIFAALNRSYALGGAKLYAAPIPPRAEATGFLGGFR
jgi:hypothetical protein